MTEDEAKTKWCPFARAPAGWGGTVQLGAPVANRTTLGQFDSACLCAGSACMAWRWNDYEETDGYCGLAGRPPSGPQLIGKP